MPPEELRRVGREFIDWVVGYLDSVGDLPVLPSTRPGDVLAQLPEAAPEKGESFDAILDDLGPCDRSRHHPLESPSLLRLLLHLRLGAGDPRASWWRRRST